MTDDCFIDTGIASEIGCPIEEFDEVKRIHDLDGRLLAVVKQIMGPVKLKLSGNHVEHRRFNLIQSRGGVLVIIPLKPFA